MNTSSRTALIALFLCVHSLTLGVAKVDAQTLHLIVVPEASDRNIQEATQVDGNNVDAMFQGNVSANNIRVYNLDGYKITSNVIQNQIRQVQAGPQDTIVLYFSGHGAYDDQQGHYLNLADNQYILRSQLTAMLKSKGARLSVLLTESCFGFDPDGPGMQAPGMIENLRNSPLFIRLFFQVEGFVDINSCKEGQRAYTYPDTADGSIFTRAFTETLSQLKNRNDLGWNDVLGIVGRRTTAEFKRLYPRGKVTRTANGRVTQRSQSPSFVTPLNVRARTVAARPTVNRPPPQVNRAPSTPSRNGGVQRAGNAPPRRNHGPQVYTVRLPLGITMGPCEEPGIHIKTVHPNSPATRCVVISNGNVGSLKPDDHILAINGVPATSVQQVQQIVAAANEITMRVRIRASGEILDIKTNLIQQRTVGGGQSSTGNNNTNNAGTDRMGLVCRSCKDGVHVDRVIPGSPATRVRVGNDVYSINPEVHVISVNGKSVNNVEQYFQALQQAPRDTWIQIKDSNGVVTPVTVTLAY